MLARQSLRIPFLALSVGILYSPYANGDLLYVGSRSNWVTRVDQATGNQLGTFADGFYALRSLTLGPDGLAYVSGITATSQWGVYRFNPTTGQALGTFEQGDLLYGIRFGSDGKFYGVDSWTDNLVQYNGSTGLKERVVMVGPPGGIGSFALGTHNDFFAITEQSKLTRYDLATGQPLSPTNDLSTILPLGHGLDQLTFGPDGDLYATYTYHSRGTPLTNGGVLRINPLTGSLIDIVINNLNAYGAEAGGTPGIVFGPNGDLYIGSQHAKAIFQYDPATWSLVGQIPLPGFVPSATDLRFLPVPEPAIGILASLPLLLLGRHRRRLAALAN